VLSTFSHKKPLNDLLTKNCTITKNLIFYQYNYDTQEIGKLIEIKYSKQIIIINNIVIFGLFKSIQYSINNTNKLYIFKIYNILFELNFLL